MLRFRLALAIAAAGLFWLCAPLQAQLPPPAGSGITIGTTPVTGGINGDCLIVSGAVVGQQACGGSGGSPGGSSGQVQWNSSGSFAGITGATTNGTALTLVAPVLGTPASVTLTNGTGLPIAGTTGWGTGVAPALANPINATSGFATYVLGSSSAFGLVKVDNTTITASAGVISAVGGSGTVTQINTGPGTTGGPCTTTCTISASMPSRINTVASGTTADFVATDSGAVVYDNRATSVAASLPAPATTGFGSGAFFERCNINTGVSTITPVSGTIGGASSYALGAGTAAAPTCVGFQSDGTNYNLVLIPGNAGTVTSASVTTANGVSASVATATTTPAFTFTLGAITPTTVNGNTVPTASDTVALLAATQSFTNKTLNSTTDVLGGVTMTLGSDATGDIYYRNSSGVLTRLAVCIGTNVLGASGGLPACVAQSGGSSTITAGTTVTSGITTGDIISSTSNLVADSGVAVSNLVLLNAANNHTAANTFSAAGALSTPGLTVSGAPVVSGGSGTTTFPQTYLNAGAAVTTFATTGTMLGINAPSAFAGSFIDVHVNGGASVFSVGVATGGAQVAIPASNAGAITLLAARNTSANSAATGTIALGNNTSNVEVTMLLNSGANTGGNGTSSFTLNNAESSGTGGVYLQTAGINAITISKAQAIGIPGIASSSAAQTGTLCWTTGTGNITVDTTVGCLTSLLVAKNITERLSPTRAMRIVAQLDPFAFRYKKGWGDSGQYEQFGLGAEEVALIDERLVGRDPGGKLQGVRYMELTAVLVGAIKEQQAEIESLKLRVH